MGCAAVGGIAQAVTHRIIGPAGRVITVLRVDDCLCNQSVQIIIGVAAGSTVFFANTHASAARVQCVREAGEHGAGAVGVRDIEDAVQGIERSRGGGSIDLSNACMIAVGVVGVARHPATGIGDACHSVQRIVGVVGAARYSVNNRAQCEPVATLIIAIHQFTAVVLDLADQPVSGIIAIAGIAVAIARGCAVAYRVVLVADELTICILLAT